MQPAEKAWSTCELRLIEERDAALMRAEAAEDLGQRYAARAARMDLLFEIEVAARALRAYRGNALLRALDGLRSAVEALMAHDRKHGA
jgi:hypothetical protein